MNPDWCKKKKINFTVSSQFFPSFFFKFRFRFFLLHIPAFSVGLTVALAFCQSKDEPTKMLGINRLSRYWAAVSGNSLKQYVLNVACTSLRGAFVDCCSPRPSNRPYGRTGRKVLKFRSVATPMQHFALTP